MAESLGGWGAGGDVSLVAEQLLAARSKTAAVRAGKWKPSFRVFASTEAPQHSKTSACSTRHVNWRFAFLTFSRPFYRSTSSTPCVRADSSS